MPARVAEHSKEPFWHEGVHFGMKAFEPKSKLQLLCEGQSEVKVGEIKCAYEDGAILEIINYMYINMASEVAAQLKVSRACYNIIIHFSSMKSKLIRTSASAQNKTSVPVRYPAD